MALHLEGKKSNIRYKDIDNFSRRHGIENAVIDSITTTLKNEISSALKVISTIGLDDKKTKALEKVVMEQVAGF